MSIKPKTVAVGAGFDGAKFINALHTKVWEVSLYDRNNFQTLRCKNTTTGLEPSLVYSKFQSKISWLSWIFVHMFSLVSFRNELFTFIDWPMNYFSLGRSLGLFL